MHHLVKDRKDTPWKIIENSRMYIMVNDRKTTTWKLLENTQLENALPGKCATWKMPEWKFHNLENARMENARHGK